jgi:hypothetical protein
MDFHANYRFRREFTLGVLLALFQTKGNLNLRYEPRDRKLLFARGV